MATALDKFADMKSQWDEPLMIESHQNGVRTKAMNPNTPITDDELVEDALFRSAQLVVVLERKNLRRRVKVRAT